MLPFMSMLVPLLALPVVARVGGVEGWAALTVGQAVGGYASAVAYAGWNVLGTPLVATAKTQSERHQLYTLAFYCRVGVLLLVAPTAAVVAAALSADHAIIIAVGAAVSSAATALGVAWYAVGVGAPLLIAGYDLLPRVIATLVSIPLVVMTQRVEPYVVALVLAPVAGLVAFHWRTWRRAVPRWVGVRAVWEAYGRNRAAWLVEASGNLYASTPVPMSAVVGGPLAAAGYGSGDRIYRYGLYAVVAFANALQGWVLGSEHGRRRRNLLSITLMSALGVVGAMGLAWLGVPISTLVFGEEVAPSEHVMLWLALAYAAVSISTPLIRNILVPLRREKSVLAVTLVSAIVGLGTMAGLGQLWGAPGIAAGLAASEIMTACACAVLAMRVGGGHERSRGARPR